MKDFERLTHLSLPDSVRIIEPIAFINTYLEGVNIGSFVADLYLPASLEVIGVGAFAGWYDLETIKFPPNLKEIGEGVFLQCKSLVLVELPESLQTIGPRAFEDCASLEVLFIPATVTSLASNAFAKCDKLQNIVILQDVVTSGHGRNPLSFQYPREWRSCEWFVSENVQLAWEMAQMAGTFPGLNISYIYANKWGSFLDTIRDLAESSIRSNRIDKRFNRRYNNW